ncbi:MAG: hypothetical protein HUJ80_01445 [Firmicutes bacterium]|nr:hypothetical protein [Bacillota bacterium]
MKYSNAFTINVTGNECFIRFVQNIPEGKELRQEPVEGLILNEKTARQLAAAINGIYSKIDDDRAQKREARESSHDPIKLS